MRGNFRKEMSDPSTKVTNEKTILNLDEFVNYVKTLS
jgi:hypothetical protein